MGMYAHKDYEVLLITSSPQWLNKHDRLPCTTYTRNFFLWKPYWMSTSAQPSTLICSAVYAINTTSVGLSSTSLIVLLPSQRWLILLSLCLLSSLWVPINCFWHLNRWGFELTVLILNSPMSSSSSSEISLSWISCSLPWSGCLFTLVGTQLLCDLSCYIYDI